MTDLVEQSASVDVAPRGEALRLTVAGGLAASGMPTAWRAATEPIERAAPHEVVIGGAGITCCDGAGLAYFAQPRRAAAGRGAAAEPERFAPALFELARRASLPGPPRT